jgi:hypothetical protein
MDRDQPIVVISHLAGVRDGSALDGGRICPDGLEYTQSVFVNIDARASGTQLVGALMDPYAPASLRKRARRRQAGKSRSNHLGPSINH